MEVQYFLSSDAMYIVQCACIVFPLSGSRMILIVLPDFHVKILHIKEHSVCDLTVTQIFAWILWLESCMASMKNNILHAFSCITHGKENLNHLSPCTVWPSKQILYKCSLHAWDCWGIKIKVT